MRELPSVPKPAHKRAVFLDRDGTINVDTHYPHIAAELQMIPEALQGLKVLSDLPFDLIIITNQSGLALSLYTEADMRQFNEALLERIHECQGRIDGIYFCPHHEAKNLPKGQAPCACSKPAPGLILEAAADFQIDLANSFMIGDKTSDILAGQRAGCKTILVRTGKGGMEEDAVPVQPDFVADHLLEAALIVKAIIGSDVAE